MSAAAKRAGLRIVKQTAEMSRERLAGEIQAISNRILGLASNPEDLPGDLRLAAEVLAGLSYTVKYYDSLVNFNLNDRVRQTAAMVAACEGLRNVHPSSRWWLSATERAARETEELKRV